MYLIDTNVFLEILLAQARRDICKDFLDTNIGNLYISDFSLHSIGVILFKNDKKSIFQEFTNDVIPKVEIITLPKEAYRDLADIRSNIGLDFDDAYQVNVAKEYDLKIVTMDKDFEKVKDEIDVMFL